MIHFNLYCRIKLPQYVLLASLVLFTSCKTLNADITHEQMLEGASPEIKNLLDSPDFTNCNVSGRTPFGDLKLANNMWGIGKLKRGTAALCTYKKGTNFGWQWDVDYRANGVIGYPGLLIGRSPWGSIERGREGTFPIQVSEISSFEVSYDFETIVKHRKFNLAFDIWLSDVEIASNKNITAEIMIWEDYFDFKSYGKVVDEISTPFGNYKVHSGYLKNDNQSQDWQYIAFVRQETRSQGNVDVAYLMNYLVAKKLISKEHYLASLELGNEVGNSSGVTLVKEFEWDIKTKE